MSNLYDQLDKLETLVKHLPGKHDQSKHAGNRGVASPGGREFRTQRDRETIAKANIQSARELQSDVIKVADDFGELGRTSFAGYKAVEARPKSYGDNGSMEVWVRSIGGVTPEKFMDKIRSARPDADFSVKDEKYDGQEKYYPYSFTVTGAQRGLKSAYYVD